MFGLTLKFPDITDYYSKGVENVAAKAHPKRTLRMKFLALLWWQEAFAFSPL